MNGGDAEQSFEWKCRGRALKAEGTVRAEMHFGEQLERWQLEQGGELSGEGQRGGRPLRKKGSVKFIPECIVVWDGFQKGH